MRIKRVIAYSVGVLATLLLFGYGAALWPVPIERTIKTETSPDGALTATYSWRPCGLIGAVTEDNPWVYLTIREQKTGRVVARHSYWGDVPGDAEEELGSQRPW